MEEIMAKVFQLGYVAVGVGDFAKTKDYYLDTLGTKLVDTDSDGAAYLSIGYSHHDIVLQPSSQQSLLHLGYQLNRGTDLDEFARDLSGLGLSPEIKSDSQPGIGKLVEVDVVGGNLMQFYESIETPAPGYNNKAISPLRLGHVALVSPDTLKLVEFYRNFLGFDATDWIGGLANFLTCNHEHHVVNLLEAGPAKLHHVAFQLRETSDHSTAADKLRLAGIPVKWGPSRHTAGHNIAAYHKDPNNVLIELYTDMDIWIPELGMCEPRPWHEDLPMVPRNWGFDELSAWNVDFDYDLAAAE